MKQISADNSKKAQIAILLAWLKDGPLSTLEVRNRGIPHCAGRIFELRKEGYRIITEWTVEHDNANQPHRIAKYCLMSVHKKGGN